MKYLLTLLLFAAYFLPEAQAGTYKHTYYWAAHPQDADMTTPKMAVYNKKGKIIAHEPRDLIKKISLEGSGFLSDGRLVNIGCSCKFPNVRFKVLNKKITPFGIDARGKPLIPFKSVAVDRKQIRLGSKMYIPKFDGLILPNGKRHNGCFIAADVGSAIHTNRIDIFSGYKSHYRKVQRKLKWPKSFKVYVHSNNCS